MHERKIQRKGEFTHKLTKNRLAKLDLKLLFAHACNDSYSFTELVIKGNGLRIL